MQDATGCTLPALPHTFRRFVQAVAVDGTSSTALLVDANTWDFLADAKMYFEAEDEQSVAAVQVGWDSCCCCTGARCKTMWSDCGSKRTSSMSGTSPPT